MNVGDAIEQALSVGGCSSNVAEKKSQAGDIKKNISNDDWCIVQANEEHWH